jgi:hypothetical protein
MFFQSGGACLNARKMPVDFSELDFKELREESDRQQDSGMEVSTQRPVFKTKSWCPL